MQWGWWFKNGVVRNAQISRKWRVSHLQIEVFTVATTACAYSVVKSLYTVVQNIHNVSLEFQWFLQYCRNLLFLWWKQWNTVAALSQKHSWSLVQIWLKVIIGILKMWPNLLGQSHKVITVNLMLPVHRCLVVLWLDFQPLDRFSNV